MSETNTSSIVNFVGIRSFILTKLTKELSKELIYHSVEHTLRVESAVMKYASLENLNEHDTLLIRTAALFHDAGFIERYEHNEELGALLFEKNAPNFGFNEVDMKLVSDIILSTSYIDVPKNVLEAIMRDADLDYLGTADYHRTAQSLFDEMAKFGQSHTPQKTLEIQLDYLKNRHAYYTESAKKLRDAGKQKRILELQLKLQAFKTTSIQQKL
jgi:predicted metal-dependent HD superfamily phosphohydrolase